jgi:hypothetical protein
VGVGPEMLSPGGFIYPVYHSLEKSQVANSNNHTTAPIGFESELWRAADALRSNMDAAEYKHAALSPNLDCITGECHATT